MTDPTASAPPATPPDSISALDGVEAVEPFAAVLAAGTVLDDLDDAARVEAWASSALGVWAEDPDAGDYDEEFLAWLDEVIAANGPHARRARLVRAAVGAVHASDRAPDHPHGNGEDDGLASIEGPPPWLGHLGTATATRAWTVERHGVASVGIGFVSNDGSEHSLLADLYEGELAALIVAPGPDELFDGSEDLVAPVPLEVADAAERIIDAWRLLRRRGRTVPESVHVNGALARARLAALTGDAVGDLRVAAAVGDDAQPDADAGTRVATLDAEDPDERAETDRWARSVLDGAIGPEPAAPSPDVDAMVEVVLDALIPERIAAQPALEAEAYRALEWADWLGIVIDAVRHGPGTHIDAHTMVDAVNRCPEVTSSIPRSDRSYYAWAFSLVLVLWHQVGVVDEEMRLTVAGVAALPAALRRAWVSS